MGRVALAEEEAAPAEEARKQELLGPHDAVDGLVWRVSNGAHWVGLVAGLLRRALKALCHVGGLSKLILQPIVDCHLQSHIS